MATFRHAVPGSILASKRLIVSDALTSSSTTKFTIEQPKNSIVDAVIVRALDALEIASGNIGCKVGITDVSQVMLCVQHGENTIDKLQFAKDENKINIEISDELKTILKSILKIE